MREVAEVEATILILRREEGCGKPPINLSVRVKRVLGLVRNLRI